MIGRKKNENLSSNAHVIHITAKEVTSRRRLDENWCDTYKKKKKIARAKGGGRKAVLSLRHTLLLTSKRSRRLFRNEISIYFLTDF